MHGNVRFALLYALGVVGGALVYRCFGSAGSGERSDRRRLFPSASLSELRSHLARPPAPLRSVIGGGHGALVGCSGGVYAIFGMHVAEIIINWDLQHKGIMNHWTRLMVTYRSSSAANCCTSRARTSVAEVKEKMRCLRSVAKRLLHLISLAYLRLLGLLACSSCLLPQPLTGDRSDSHA